MPILFSKGYKLKISSAFLTFLQVEEAKLIMELAELDAINDGLFKQAYTASIDVNELLKKYKISEILKEPYDKEGASLTIESGSGGIYNEVSNCSFPSLCPHFMFITN